MATMCVWAYTTVGSLVHFRAQTTDISQIIVIYCLFHYEVKSVVYNVALHTKSKACAPININPSNLQTCHDHSELSHYVLPVLFIVYVG